MFEFLKHLHVSYNQRAVSEFDDKEKRIRVSTAKVLDGFKPFETGVYHPFYNRNKCMIVEAYDTLEQAVAGQERWVKIMTSDDLPPVLKDAVNCDVAQMLRDIGDPLEYPLTKPIKERTE